MKKLIFLFAIAASVASCSIGSKEKINYPVTKTGDVVDTIFGTPVADPYRWLEDDMSEETAAWVREQNKVTFGYLEGIPYREQIKERLTQIWNYEKFSMPFREGD
jgi:prolyl oligopeptidase